MATIPGGGNGNLLQYSWLENPMDRGAWRATVHGVSESDKTKHSHTNGNTGYFFWLASPLLIPAWRRVDTSRKKCLSWAAFSLPVGTGDFIDLDSCLQEQEFFFLFLFPLECYSRRENSPLLICFFKSSDLKNIIKTYSHLILKRKRKS